MNCLADLIEVMINMKKRNTHLVLFAIVVLLAIVLPGCRQGETTSQPLPAPNVFEDSVRVRIADLQHARDATGLIGFTDRQHKKDYRLAAIRGLASVQDSSVSPQLIDLLSDPDMEIVQAAAYALGQTGQGANELLVAGMAAKDESSALILLEACGKVGSAGHLDSLLAQTAAMPSTGHHQAGVMAACFRFGVRGIVRVETAARAYQLIQSGSKVAQHWACAFVGRVGALGMEADSNALDLALAVKLPPDDLQHLVKRLGKCAPTFARPRLERYLADEKADWRVRVSAIRALRALGDGSVTLGLQAALKSEIAPLAMEAAAYLLEHCGKTQADEGVALTLANSTTEPVLQASIFAAAIKHAEGKPGADSVHAVVLKALAATKDPTVRGLCYLALSYDRREEDFLAQHLLDAPAGPERTGIMTGLSQLYVREPGKQKSRVELLQRAVESGDVALMGIAATLLRDPATGLDKAVRDTSFLAAALTTLKLPRDIETANEIQRTINHINGRPDAPLAPIPPAGPIDWKLVRGISSHQIWVMETSKGMIRIELDVESAPSTVGNIVRLVRDQYFDGKLFHRVVPNFVAQAGCPRGDGWGSVEPMIRSEWPGIRFSEGAVGMASAGKDTESCQFFITHSSTPHLDGRYTVFGYVVQGMDVVSRLNIGDTIKRSYLD